MLLKCKKCGKEFERSRKPKDENKVFCSLKCFHDNNIVKIKCKCAYCNKEIEKTPYELKKSKTGNTFCNKSCAASFNNTEFRTGENNPNWKNGGINYRKIAFESYLCKCANCGFDNKDALEVHHIDNDRSNNKLNNLITLCPNCHTLVHKNLLSIDDEMLLKRK